MTEQKPPPIPEDFFRSFPKEVTEVPLFEDENGLWFAYGHLEPEVMIEAILAADNYQTDNQSSIVRIDPKNLQYRYAKIYKIDDTSIEWEDEVTFEVCKPTDEGALPITVW